MAAPAFLQTAFLETWLDGHFPIIHSQTWPPYSNGSVFDGFKTSTWQTVRILSYWQHCVEVSGTEVNRAKWQESREKSQLLEIQTAEIAGRLRAVGIRPERVIDGEMSIVGVASGISEKLTSWRHINFLPAVAASNRSQLVKRLSFFAEKKPWLRYLVVTNGTRCSVDDLKGRIQALSRSVSRFAALPQLKEMGVTVELRVTELTAKRDDVSGEWTYHPHANVIINCSKMIDWRSFLTLATRNLPGHWQDNGRIVDANECVKYFVKPGDVMEHKPLELAFLFLATFGVRLIAPMNDFKRLGFQMKGDRVKLGKKLDADRINWQWCFIRLRDPKQFLSHKSPARDNCALALLPPQPRFTERFEPVVMVRNYSGNVTEMLIENGLEKLFAPSRTAWQFRGKAASAIPFTPSPQLTERSVAKTGSRTREYQLQPP